MYNFFFAIRIKNTLGAIQKVRTLRGGGRGVVEKRTKAYYGEGGVNALAYVRFEKNSTSNCCFPTHIRVSYSFLRPDKIFVYYVSLTFVWKWDDNDHFLTYIINECVVWIGTVASISAYVKLDLSKDKFPILTV